MKTKFKLTKSLLETIKKFYDNEQGVYVVMTALLAFPLLFLIAFTVDGTGALLDRARLAQATDQATLLLITEDNSNRDHIRDQNKHTDLIGQDVSKEEAEAKKNGSPFNTMDAKIKKRNQQLVQGLVKLYLRSDDSSADKNSSPVTIPNDFLAECKEKTTNAGQNGRRKDVACTVEGTVQRKFILPWSHSLVTPEQLKDGRLAVNSGQAYAIKEKQFPIPLELILVTDFSGSMKQDLSGKDTNIDSERKVTILRQAVKEISEVLLPEKSKDSEVSVSPFNRMGFATFSGGVREKNETSQCVLPYKLKENPQKLRIWDRDQSILGVKIDPNRCETITETTKQGEIKRNACYTLSAEYPTKILSKALKEKKGQISLWKSIEFMFDDSINVTATIDQVKEFRKGKKTIYPYKFEDGYYCLGDNTNQKTTQTWFDQSNKDITSALNKITPKGATAATSGMIIGAELLMDSNPDKNASPETLGVNTRRIMIVLSDGEDNSPTPKTLLTLLNAGLCNTIREQVNTLQDTRYPLQNTEIHFIAFGFKPDQPDAWRQCTQNKYYEVGKEEDLVKTFKQIISFEEEVGRSSSSKPKLFQ